ncbi:hypothetical protein [Morganella morganii]|uniref:hypothetical protein n=1 Tax=Morganella morganii TaxID=582 RepID=UPI001AB05273|nr:hypothetical protein [Morganella morganii]
MALTEREHEYLSDVLSRLENILSTLANIPIYSTITIEKASGIFFSLFTYTFIKELSFRMLNEYKNNFFSNLHSIINIESNNSLTPDLVVLKVKCMINNNIKNIIKNKNIEKSISSYISKMDKRSFPKIPTILKYKEKLFEDAIFFKETEETGRMVSSLFYEILLAGRAAFYLSKYVNKITPSINDIYIQENTVAIIQDYILNDNIDINDMTYSKNCNLMHCKNYFLNSIGQQDPLNYLKQYGTKALWIHDNGVFLSYCLREQLYNDINTGRNTVWNLSDIIELLDRRQSGEDGLYIAMFGIIFTFKQKGNVTHNFLEPLINYYIDCQEIFEMKGYVYKTIFSKYLADDLTIRDINLALAIRTYNSSVDDGIIKDSHCNPLKNLDKVLQCYFSSNEITDEMRKIIPVWGIKETIYDALKKINFHIVNYGLHKEIGVNTEGEIFVKKSIAGYYINKFLSLNNDTQREILNEVSPSEYAIDINKLVDKSLN